MYGIYNVPNKRKSSEKKNNDGKEVKKELEDERYITIF